MVERGEWWLRDDWLMSLQGSRLCGRARFNLFLMWREGGGGRGRPSRRRVKSIVASVYLCYSPGRYVETWIEREQDGESQKNMAYAHLLSLRSSHSSLPL